MKNILLFCVAMGLSGPSFASEALSSELSHTLAGVLMGGAATAVADNYWPEHRVLIGISFAATAGVIGEIYDSTRPNGRFSVLDVAVTTIGGAIGAYVTDRWILLPVATRQQSSRYYGIMAGYRF